MRKSIAFALGAALVAPVMWATPAQAQSARSIQRLEERVQEAKNRGDWGRVQQLEQQLNMDRLQYQRRNGMGENYENPRYQNGYYQNGYNRGYYNNNPYSNRQRGSMTGTGGSIRGITTLKTAVFSTTHGVSSTDTRPRSFHN